jgi:nitrogenase-stabilizing/protective protein
MTAILEQLRHLSATEEFFELLDVPYDPAVLRVARLHILRRMGQSLADNTLDGLAEAAAREQCRAHLARAYADFVASRPIEQRVFKVLKDAVAPRRKAAFVPLSTLSQPR